MKNRKIIFSFVIFLFLIILSNICMAKDLDKINKYYITVDKTTGKPSKWEIKYTDLKRVAYFISTDKSASAFPTSTPHLSHNR